MQGITTAIVILTLGAMPALASDTEQRAADSRSEVKAFATELKGELVEAMQNGGPIAAVNVCNARAPEIAASASERTGWKVGRTSLKLRNPANSPDDWERTVLEDFETRKAAGEDPKKLEYFTVMEQDGKQQFRYMKAIPVGEVCVVCHGTTLQKELQVELEKLYPEDQARGYKPGDIRGAFTIVQPM